MPYSDDIKVRIVIMNRNDLFLDPTFLSPLQCNRGEHVDQTQHSGYLPGALRA